VKGKRSEEERNEEEIGYLKGRKEMKEMCE